MIFFFLFLFFFRRFFFLPLFHFVSTLTISLTTKIVCVFYSKILLMLAAAAVMTLFFFLRCVLIFFCSSPLFHCLLTSFSIYGLDYFTRHRKLHKNSNENVVSSIFLVLCCERCEWVCLYWINRIAKSTRPLFFLSPWVSFPYEFGLFSVLVLFISYFWSSFFVIKMEKFWFSIFFFG